ncbi:TPA: hypothetical protein RNS68_000985 [Stenotrophomonas maltophilia]|nr:hypothetical protein [Stenotrophomonas maltophilia]
MSQFPAPCPICETEGAIHTPNGGATNVNCPACRLFRVSGTAEAIIKNWSSDKKGWLSGRARRHWASTHRHYVIDSTLLDEIDGPELNTVPSKQNALLVDIAADSKHPGAGVMRGLNDIHAIDASNITELRYHIRSLTEWGLLSGANMTYTITPAGWEYLERLRFPVGGNRSDFFVAMSFSPALRDAYENGIKPGAEAAGYNARRVDSVDHNDKIDDRIIAGIRGSYGVIVDVTTQNAGAYFEAGFALGLGRPVVWTVRQDDLPKLHFDTRQFRHIVWTDEADLREQLTTHLLAVFGRGPVAP